MKLALTTVYFLTGLIGRAETNLQVQSNFIKMASGRFNFVNIMYSVPKSERRSSVYCPKQRFIVTYHPKAQAAFGPECGAALSIADADAPIFCQVDSNLTSMLVKLMIKDGDGSIVKGQNGKPIIMYTADEAGMVDSETAKMTLKSENNKRFDEVGIMQTEARLRLIPEGVELELNDTFKDGKTETTKCSYKRSTSPSTR